MNRNTYILRGGKSLNGSIKVPGAKNLVNKLIVASLLTDAPCRIYNVPNITEVNITLDLCSEVGSHIIWNKEEKYIQIHTPNILNTQLSQKYSGSNRIPILLLGALLNRTNKTVTLPYVGGDAIGDRPINFHTLALEKLGASIEIVLNKGSLPIIKAINKSGFKSTNITLNYPSVGATENVLFAAVCATGITTIYNAAMEPEIMALIAFLQQLGAQIYITSDRTIMIHGVKQLTGTEFHVMEDRNVVISYALSALLTNGRITVIGANQNNILSFLGLYLKLGGGFKQNVGSITFYQNNQLNEQLNIETDTHPGFMTDWQQVTTVALTQCKGTSTIHETVYENRFGFITALNKMRANIELSDRCLGTKKCRFRSKNQMHSIKVRGPTPLIGTNVTVPDLRAGFSYILAGLIAQGTTTLHKAHLIDRGYEDIVGTLQKLGADIQHSSSQPIYT